MAYPWRRTYHKLNCRPFNEVGYPPNPNKCDLNCPYWLICRYGNVVSKHQLHYLKKNVLVEEKNRKEVIRERYRECVRKTRRLGEHKQYPRRNEISDISVSTYKQYHKEYDKIYGQRPEVIERRKQYNKEYCQRPEVKERYKKRKKYFQEYNKEYTKRPEVKERIKKYHKEYDKKKRDSHRN